MKVADLFAKLGLRTDKASFNKGTRAIRGLGSQLKKIGGLLGGLTLALTAKNAFDFTDSINRLSIASNGALGSVDAFRKKILEASDATGVSKEDIAAGAAQFISLTGDTETATKALETFARVAAATGSASGDIASAAAAMRDNLGITADSLEKGFSILIAGGKAGAIELKDAAGLLAAITPQAAQFAGGRGISGLASLSAALQLVRKGTGSASQAATALEALMGSIKRSAVRFKAAGVDVFNIGTDGKKSLKGFQEIIEAIGNSKLAKDPTALIAALGSKEAEAAFVQLTSVKGAWDNLRKSTLAADDVNKDFQKRMQQGTARLLRALNKLKNFATRVMFALVDGFIFLADHIESVAITVGSLATAFVLLKSAMIGAAIQSAIAWIAALLPFVLLGAAIAAVFLIVEDLWVAFHGGESVFKDLYIAAKNWFLRIPDLLDDVLSDVQDKFGETFAAQFGLGGAAKARNKERRRRENVQRNIERQQAKAQGRLAVLARDKNLPLSDRIAKRQATLQQLGAAGVANSDSRVQTAQREIKLLKQTQTNNINVTISGNVGDAENIGDIVKRNILSALDQQNRAAAEALAP